MRRFRTMSHVYLVIRVDNTRSDNLHSLFKKKKYFFQTDIIIRKHGLSFQRSYKRMVSENSFQGTPAFVQLLTDTAGSTSLSLKHMLTHIKHNFFFSFASY